MKFIIAVLLFASVSPLLFAKGDLDYFYVYTDKGDVRNHYVPSGWMGDYGDLKLDEGNREKPQSGKTAMKWTYSGEMMQGAGWAGVYWQHPTGNWGNVDSSYDLSGYKRLTFWARGNEGGELINEFKVGGIEGDFHDSDSATIGPVELTKDWKKYTIDLAHRDLSKIIGGFCWSASRSSNPNGFVIYLDEIRFEN